MRRFDWPLDMDLERLDLVQSFRQQNRETDEDDQTLAKSLREKGQRGYLESLIGRTTTDRDSCCIVRGTG
jgi:hypothetical protein